MNPQQPYQPPPRPGSEYDFFMNPQKPQKPSPLSRFGAGSSMTMRIVVIVVGAFVVIILISFMLSLFAPKSNRPDLLVVAQDQNELIRVAGLANTTGTTQSSQSTKNFAQSASLSLGTEQQDLLAYMAVHGGKVSPKLLIATKNLTTDTTLNNALASSTFDSAFTSAMQTQLKAYQAALKTAYASSRTTAAKQLLNDDYNSASMLLTQINSPDQ